MQKEMKVCTSFASAYGEFKEAFNLKNEAGGYVAFKQFLDDNNYQIDEKDVLFNAFLVGQKIENEEKKMEKSEEKIKLTKLDHCTYEGSNGKVYIRLSSGEMREALPGHNRESIKKQKMKDRLWYVGVLIMLVIVFFTPQLHGYDPHEKMINEVKIELQNARKAAKEVVIPPSPVSCEGKKIKYDGLDYHHLKQEFTNYSISLYGGFYTSSQKDWFAQNTAVLGDTRVLCVNKKRVKDEKSKHTH